MSLDHYRLRDINYLGGFMNKLEIIADEKNHISIEMTSTLEESYNIIFEALINLTKNLGQQDSFKALSNEQQDYNLKLLYNSVEKFSKLLKSNILMLSNNPKNIDKSIDTNSRLDENTLKKAEELLKNFKIN